MHHPFPLLCWYSTVIIFSHSLNDFLEWDYLLCVCHDTGKVHFFLLYVSVSHFSILCSSILFRSGGLNKGDLGFYFFIFFSQGKDWVILPQ